MRRYHFCFFVHKHSECDEYQIHFRRDGEASPKRSEGWTNPFPPLHFFVTATNYKTARLLAYAFYARVYADKAGLYQRCTEKQGLRPALIDLIINEGPHFSL